MTARPRDLPRRGPSEKRNVLERAREVIYPLLVVAIVGSLWFVARVQAVEEEVRLGTPPSPHWIALERAATLSTD